MENLGCCLHSSLQGPAIILPGKTPKTVTHSALAENVVDFRRSLRYRGFQKGKKIALVLANPHLLTVAFFATTLQSCIANPLNHNLKSPEYQFYLEDFGAELVILAETDIAKETPAYVTAKSLGLPIAICSANEQTVEIRFLEESPTALKGKTDDANGSTSKEAGPDGSTYALVLHTSGTTGKPKAVALSHKNLCTSINNIRHHYNLTAQDRISVIMPLFHIHGIVCALLTPLAVGSAVIFPPPPASGLTPSFLRDAAEHNATWYTATPTLHRLVLRMPLPKDKPLTFRFIRSCSSPLDTDLLNKLESQFNCPVTEAYAMTEAAHQVCSNPISPDRKPSSVGTPTGVSVKILNDRSEELEPGEIGEICIAGPNVFEGYANNKAANNSSFTVVNAAKYFRTGDQGFLSPQNYLSITGRIKELINKGGEKIGPVEIDVVVSQHPYVAEAVTFAVPDDMYGEEVGLAVVPEQGCKLSEKDLKAWIAARLAQMKVPKRVWFVDEIPKTAVGKLQRGLVAKKMLESSVGK